LVVLVVDGAVVLVAGAAVDEGVAPVVDGELGDEVWVVGDGETAGGPTGSFWSHTMRMTVVSRTPTPVPTAIQISLRVRTGAPCASRR
jgi:hypothetical protein